MLIHISIDFNLPLAFLSSFSATGIVTLLFALALILAGGIVHEFGHAWAAAKLGDGTAQAQGRLTFHPLPHLDPFLSGVLPLITLLVAGVPFGGMKPVPVYPLRLRRPDRDLMWTALAGPVFQLAFVAVLVVALLLLSPLFGPDSIAFAGLTLGILLNVLIAIFNLIPVPPLDGSKILRFFLPPDLRRVYDTVGPVVAIALLIGVLFAGFLGGFFRTILNVNAEIRATLFDTFGLHNLITLWS